MALHFVETKVFSKRVVALGLDEELRALQHDLMANPDAGDRDPGTGGLRKVRMRDPGRQKGKRGGARVHYLHLAAHDVIYLLFVYAKDEQDILTAREKKELRVAVEAIKREWEEQS